MRRYEYRRAAGSGPSDGGLVSLKRWVHAQLGWRVVDSTSVMNPDVFRVCDRTTRNELTQKIKKTMASMNNHSRRAWYLLGQDRLVVQGFAQSPVFSRTHPPRTRPYSRDLSHTNNQHLPIPGCFRHMTRSG